MSDMYDADDYADSMVEPTKWKKCACVRCKCTRRLPEEHYHNTCVMCREGDHRQ